MDDGDRVAPAHTVEHVLVACLVLAVLVVSLQLLGVDVDLVGH